MILHHLIEESQVSHRDSMANYEVININSKWQAITKIFINFFLDNL